MNGALVDNSAAISGARAMGAPAVLLACRGSESFSVENASVNSIHKIN